MANWTTLKAAIADVIKTNGNQEITGAVLQNTLNNIVSSLGENATFAGIATPTTNPGAPDGVIFYIASGNGSFPNFGINLSNEICVISNKSGNWVKSKLSDTVIIDNKFDSQSENPVENKVITEKINDIEIQIAEQKNEVDAAKEEALNSIDEAEQNVLENFSEQRVTPEMLSEETLQLIETAGGGTINNMPDGEDLTTKDLGLEVNVLKFADKSYMPEVYSGLGRIYVRKNITDGKNILTQEMINNPNCIYIIQYDYDLNSLNIVLPENCVLLFVGGSLDNGTLSLNETEILGTLECFGKNLIIDGSIKGEYVLFDWWKCEKSTSEEYSTFINGTNTEFGIVPQISDTNRLILKNHIDKYIIKFGLGIYPFDDLIEINGNFKLKGIDTTKTLIWCPNSSFLYMSSGGALYPFIENISIEAYNNVLQTLGNKGNTIHGLLLNYVKCISYKDHVFYNNRSASSGTVCPIYGSKANFSQFYAGRDKGCFTNYVSASNIYENIVDAFTYFNGVSLNFKGIMRCLFWNSTVFEMRESNILYGGMKYVAYYDNEITPTHTFNARRCIFEGAGNTEVAEERKGFLNIIKCDSAYGSISNFHIRIEDCQLVTNTFDEGVAINLSGAVANCYANIPSDFYVYGTNGFYNTGENIVYAISKPLDVQATKRRLLIYNNTGNISTLRRENLIPYSQEIASSLNVPTSLINKCEELGNMSYIAIGVNYGNKNAPIIMPDENISSSIDGSIDRENEYLKYKIGSNVYKITCTKSNSYIVSSYNNYKRCYDAGYSNCCFIIVGDIDLNGETIAVRANITFLFLGGSINNGIISSITNTKFVNFSGTATFNVSTDYGSFADKPQNPYKGQQYFCTNKQTAEGSNNGIPIYYNGTNWVDAMGRIIE